MAEDLTGGIGSLGSLGGGERGPIGGGPLRPEQDRGHEDFRRRQEAVDRLPFGAEHLINSLLSAEVGEAGDVTELKKAIDTALAYREGLTFGVSGAVYEFDPANPRDRLKVANLQRMFTTVEGSISRSGTAVTYINAAIENALDGRILRAQEHHDGSEGWNASERRRLESQNEAYRRAKREDLVLSPEQIASTIGDEAKRMVNEYEAIPRLVELKSDADSRAVLDQAFVIRMRTCEDPGLASKVGSSEIYCPTPDSPHWAAIFGGEVTDDYGKGVANVFEEMVKMALPNEVISRLGMESIPTSVRSQVKENVYAKGFESAIGFGTWLNHLLEKANGRMDMVWGAWKLALTLEVIDTLGQTIDETKNREGEKNNKFVLAAPPLGNALMTFLNHLREKRMVEYGLKADGKRFSTEKFVGHAGLPMSIDHIPDLCSDYLHESTVKFDKRGLVSMGSVARNLSETKNLPRVGDVDYDKKYDKLREDLNKVINGGGSETFEISLWDLWLYGRTSFADPNFPWYQTDQPDADATPGELSLGSFGMWLLTRSRASKVLDDIKSQPSLQDLGAPGFFAERLRNWTKVLGPLKDSVKPEDNPRAWWVMGVINLHLGSRRLGGIKLKSGIIEENPELEYSWTAKGQDISPEAPGKAERSVSLGDVFESALRCGFLRKVDVDFINKKLGMQVLPRVLS